MEYRNPQTKKKEGEYTYKKSCVTCDREFEDGEKRNEWRMRLTDQSKYHAGSFWTIHCDDCFVKTMVLWRDTMNRKLNEIGERI